MLSCLRHVCLSFLCLLLVAAAGTARADINTHLRGQINPFPGENNRYGDVWGENNYAYVASYNGSGVVIIDITNPDAPRVAGRYDPGAGGRFQDVVVINGIGYFSSENDGGVHIVDVRNPAATVLLSQITQAQQGFPRVHELFVADGILYEADARTPRVKVFDVRDPQFPVFVRNIDTTDSLFIHNITAMNGRLYTSGWGGKTDIYDVRNIISAPPFFLGSIDSGRNSHSSWVSSDGVLLASARETADGDVRLFDVSNPANPVQLATITANSLGTDAFSPHNPYIIGHLLFVSWYQAGTQVMDISNPSSPKLVGSFDTFPGQVNGFDGNWGVYPFLALDRVLLSDMDAGLFVVDFTDAVTGPRTVSAASYSIAGVAEKSIVAAFGTNLATSAVGASMVPLPTILAGTQVRIRDSANTERFAPLFYVSQSQVNYQIPEGTAPGPAAVVISNGNGAISTGVTIVARAAPSVFTINQTGSGAAAALDAFTFTGPPFSPTRNGGQPNQIAIYATGLGADATDMEGDVKASVEVTIDGLPATTTYAGAATGFVGLNQLNVALPSGITAGDHTVIVKRNGRTSNPVTIGIR